MCDRALDHIRTTRGNIFDARRSGKKPKSGARELNRWGWYGTLYEIAEIGTLGDLKAVERTNMWRFLDVLSIKRTHDKIMMEANDK